jgi:hypothetical protein
VHDRATTPSSSRVSTTPISTPIVVIFLIAGVVGFTLLHATVLVVLFAFSGVMP